MVNELDQAVLTGKDRSGAGSKKYQSIRDYLLAEILEGKLKTGSRILPEYELAKQFSVSRGTVQKAISELMYDGYLVRKQKSGTFVTGTSAKRSNLISLVIPFSSGVGYNDVHSSIMDGAEKALVEHGYHILLCRMGPFYNEAENRVSSLKGKNIDGIIFDPLESLQCDEDNESLARILGAPERPIVLVDRRWQGPIGSTLSCVTSDNFGGSYELTRHLVSQGYTRIAYLRAFSNSSEQRYQGYQKALTEAGIPLRPEYQLAISFPRVEQQGVQEVDVLIAMAQPPEVIMCAFDFLARNVISRLRERGVKVPHQMGVVGFDDNEAARMSDPPLTTVRQDGEEIGRRASELLIRSIADNSPSPVDEIVPCELVVRNSVLPRSEFTGLKNERNP